MSRLLKELKSLAPWQWDARVGKHPAGPATLRDFEKIGDLIGATSEGQQSMTLVASSVEEFLNHKEQRQRKPTEWAKKDLPAAPKEATTAPHNAKAELPTPVVGEKRKGGEAERPAAQRGQHEEDGFKKRKTVTEAGSKAQRAQPPPPPGVGTDSTPHVARGRGVAATAAAALAAGATPASVPTQGRATPAVPPSTLSQQTPMGPASGGPQAGPGGHLLDPDTTLRRRSSPASATGAPGSAMPTSLKQRLLGSYQVQQSPMLPPRKAYMAARLAEQKLTVAGAGDSPSMPAPTQSMGAPAAPTPQPTTVTPAVGAAGAVRWSGSSSRLGSAGGGLGAVDSAAEEVDGEQAAAAAALSSLAAQPAAKFSFTAGHALPAAALLQRTSPAPAHGAPLKITASCTVSPAGVSPQPRTVPQGRAHRSRQPQPPTAEQAAALALMAAAPPAPMVRHTFEFAASASRQQQPQHARDLAPSKGQAKEQQQAKELAPTPMPMPRLAAAHARRAAAKAAAMGVASRAEPSPLGQRVMAAMPLGWQLASAAGEPLPLWMDLLRNAPVTLQQQSAHERAHRSALTKGPHMAKPHQLPTPAPLSPSYTLPPAGPSKVARPPTPIPRAALEAPAVAGEQQPVLEILPLQLLSKGPVDEHWLAALSPQVRALADSLINGQLMLQQLLLYNAQMGTQAQAPAAAPAAFVPAAAAPLIDRPAIPVQQLPVQQALASASGALAMEASAAMEAMAAAAAAQASPGSSQEDKENKQPANSPSSSKWKAQLC